jgi:tricorn protease-like protein
MRRLPVLLLAFVGVATLAVGSKWTSPARTATPSGKLILFTGKELGVVNANGRGRAQILRKLGDVDQVELSPDHRRVGLIDRSRRLFVVNVRGNEGKRLIAKNVESFTWSPDTRQIAYSAVPTTVIGSLVAWIR